MRRPPAPGTTGTPATFAVVGQDRADPDRLLLLGEDGRYYAFHLPDGPAVAVEPGGDEWAVEPDIPSVEDLFG
jgi:hypothetical protein